MGSKRTPVSPTIDMHGRKHAYRRAAGILLIGIIALNHSPTAAAADVGLGITLSPEAVRMIRDWRQANGLPLPPEPGAIQPTLYSSCCGLCARLQAPQEVGEAASPHPLSIKKSSGTSGTQYRSLKSDDGYCILAHTSV